MRGRGSVVVVGACLAASALLTGCRSEEPASVPVATPSPTPSASEPPPPAALALTHRVEAISVSAADVLSKSGGVTPARRAIDEGALADLADRVTALLRDHLEDLNDGGAGRLADREGGPWGADPGLDALATTALASPGNPATAADLVVRVGVDGVPLWAQAELVVTRHDGSRVRLDLVLDANEDLRVLVLGAEEVAA